MTFDWRARIALTIIVLVCIGVVWRLAPRSSGPGPDREVRGARRSHGRAVTPQTLPWPPQLPSRPDAGGDRRGATHESTYRLLQPPSRTVALPPQLDNISDVALADDAASFWGVNDEDDGGRAYRISAADGSIQRTIAFGPKGTYEAIARVDGRVFVARNDGVLWVIDVEKGSTTIVDTQLGPSCNLEGLAFEPAQHRLLLSCKSVLPKLPSTRKSFGIFALNLQTLTVDPAPVIVLTRQAIDDYIGTHSNQPGLQQTMADEFSPKAIAVNPISGQLYLVSARSTMLVVLEPTGALVRVEALDPTYDPQPEGLTFAPDGTLYISNKARGGQAHLQAYSPTGG